jgi:hypothetical protein
LTDGYALEGAGCAAYTRAKAGGQRVATNGVQTLVLAEPDGPAGGRLFRRRAVRGAGTPDAQPVEWAVAELDGVRSGKAMPAATLTATVST